MKAIEIISRGLRVFLKMVCVFLLLSSQAWAALEVTASSFSFNSFTLAQRVDSSNSLTFDAVTRTLAPTPVPNAFALGHPHRQGVWHSVSLRNTTAQDIEYVLYNKSWYNFREVDVLIAREDGTVVQSYRAGYGRERGQHTGDLPGSYSATLAPDAQQTLHIKTVIDDGFPAAYDYRLMDRRSATESIVQEQALLAALLAVLVTLFVYNIFILISTQAVIYLHYVSYLLFALVINAVYVTGMLFRYVDLPLGLFPWFNAAPPLTGVFIVLFSRELLRTRDFFPRIDRGLRGLVAISGAFALCAAYLGPTVYWQLALIFLLILSVALVGVGLYTAFIGHRFGTFYMLTTASYLGFAIWGLGFYLKLVPAGFVAFHSVLLGSIIEGFGLSLLLAYRLKVMREENVRLDILSSTDELTRLPNRRSTLASLEVTFRQGRAAVLLIDIDHFKRINDSHGHDTGDAALVHIANVLKDFNGMIGRVGGEEFLAVLEGVTGPELMARAEALRMSVIARPFREGMALTVSIGGTMQVDGDRDIGQLMKRADLALYEAKDSGRNRTVMR